MLFQVIVKSPYKVPKLELNVGWVSDRVTHHLYTQLMRYLHFILELAHPTNMDYPSLRTEIPKSQSEFLREDALVAHGV